MVMRFIKKFARMAWDTLLTIFMEKALLYLLSSLGIMFSFSLVLRFILPIILPGFDNTSSFSVAAVERSTVVAVERIEHTSFSISETLPESIREDVDSSLSALEEPKYDEAITSLNRSALEEQKYDEAITSLNRVISREPKTGVAYQLRSLAYEKKGKNHEAVKDSTKRIKLIQEMKQKQKEYTTGKEDTIGDEIDAYYARSHIYLKLGKKKKAAEDWEKISVLQADNKKKYREYYQQ